MPSLLLTFDAEKVFDLKAVLTKFGLTSHIRSAIQSFYTLTSARVWTAVFSVPRYLIMEPLGKKY